MGLIITAFSTAILLLAVWVQLNKVKTDPVFIMVTFTSLITLVSFYLGFRLLGLPMYVIMIIYMSYVFPFYACIGTVRDIVDGRAFKSSDLVSKFIGYGGLICGVVFAALVIGYEAFYITPELQQAFNKSPIDILGTSFTWLETTTYTEADIAVAYQTFRSAFIVAMILTALWFLASLVIFVGHRRERRRLMAQIENFKEKNMFSAALGTAQRAAEIFPGDNEIKNLAQNLKFVVGKETEDENLVSG